MLGFAASTFACGGYNQISFTTLAQKAISTDPSVASDAIASLREQGPAGLDALLSAHASVIQQHQKYPLQKLSTTDQASWERLQHALDAVGAQHDCAASHLFWYTNFDDALSAAKTSGKPILSLRLLGKLDEEYSCANSRFFRTTLYANAEVSQYLRDHFILHWKSVRPIPRITVDFGDGRKIERTVTGNSIHYILDSNGQVVDALPGLYGPKAFLKGLADADAAAMASTRVTRESMKVMLSCGALPPQTATNNREMFLHEYHAQRLSAINQAWANDMASLIQEGSAPVNASSVTDISRSLQIPLFNEPVPTAVAASRTASSKSRAESSLISSFQPSDDATWTRIAGLHAQDAALDNASVTLIKSKNPSAVQAGRAAFSKMVVESPLTAMLQNLQRSIAEDTVRNEYLFHSQIHEWLINNTDLEDVEQLNSLVYAKLFLTPDSDPWLGLVPANTFTGLDNNGLVQASPKR